MADFSPIRLSEIHFNDTTTTPSLYSTLKNLKKTTLSLHNRLRSIQLDTQNLLTTIHPSNPYPLIANERCGSWYIPPTHKSGSAYFKSTDGHYGSWAFSLRRLNLPTLEILGGHGGAVLVDSTRRGKRMPDALRRTVPIWTVIWNRVLFLGREGFAGGEWAWAWRLQHPGLEDAEVRVIESKIELWVEGLKGLGLDLEALRKKICKPIRLKWVVAGEEEVGFDSDGVDGVELLECSVLVLVSASKPVLGAEMSEEGYIQGAADDAEGWSGGLTAKLFWAHQDEIMATQEEDLPDLLARLVEADRSRSDIVDAVQITPTQNLFVAAAPSGSLFPGPEDFDLVICCNKDAEALLPHVICLGCRSGKLGSKDLREQLPMAVDVVKQASKKNKNSRTLVVCETGKDLSAGLAVSLLCLLYDEEGQLLASGSNVIDKQFVKKRLAWISTAKPDANPSRSTLQAVNSFMMERPS